MNGNCYFSEGLNPPVTCNKNEGNRIAIPVIDAGRRTMVGYNATLKAGGELHKRHSLSMQGTTKDSQGAAR